MAKDAKGHGSDALNYMKTGGSFDKTVRRLKTMTIVKNETSGRYVVKNNKTGATEGSGYATVEQAHKAHAHTDALRTNMVFPSREPSKKPRNT